MWLYQEGPADAGESVASAVVSPSGSVGRETAMLHPRSDLVHVEATAGRLLSRPLLERRGKKTRVATHPLPSSYTSIYTGMVTNWSHLLGQSPPSKRREYGNPGRAKGEQAHF